MFHALENGMNKRLIGLVFPSVVSGPAPGAVS